MLPRLLYELLPYAYLVIGIIGGVLIDSTIIFISSVLLLSAGILVLMMRYNYRRDASARRLQIVEAAQAKFESSLSVDGKLVMRSATDRRCYVVASFPVVDEQGYLVKFDRRAGERRAA